MSAVWKFQIAWDQPAVEMPDGAKVLTAAVQDQTVCIWALVDPDAPKVRRHFRVYGTGHKHPGDGRYISTVFMGPLVFHVFEHQNQGDSNGG
jgi:hypothetical protein